VVVVTVLLTVLVTKVMVKLAAVSMTLEVPRPIVDVMLISLLKETLLFLITLVF
jgi:hypothetical protein